MTHKEQAHEAALKFAELHYNLVKENSNDAQTNNYNCYSFGDFVNLYLITFENIYRGLSEGTRVEKSYPESIKDREK